MLCKVRAKPRTINAITPLQRIESSPSYACADDKSAFFNVHVRFALPAQPVDATQALNFSAGVSNPRVLRGRSLSWRATLLRWACEYTDKSAPFGKYCLSRPLVFSLEPRCHGLCGSQK